MMEVYFHSKTQRTTVKYSQPFSKHTRAPTLSDVPHKTPSTVPLQVISQHEITFLQSESLQTRARQTSTVSEHELTFLQSGTLQTHQDIPLLGCQSTCIAEQHLSI
jgi:hypothetical protein